MDEGMTYEKAYTELASISREMEEGGVSVDLLAEKVRRASELIRFCQSRLRDTETEVNRIIEGLSPEGEP
ncbi:MAG: exodeoxyribonuclease VII small subunit [Chitinophagia bacterium]|nr:exodeoxyribonuclease VII small subunit [Chitinophagia bacterium]